MGMYDDCHDGVYNGLYFREVSEDKLSLYEALAIIIESAVLLKIAKMVDCPLGQMLKVTSECFSCGPFEVEV
jgi:hypothetical protein